MRACTRAASSRQVLLHWGMHAVHAGRFKSSQATLRSPAEPSQPVLLSIACPLGKAADDSDKCKTESI
ncbi:TPA: hypothetical protein ACH3X3_007833 [Trebouxia sp. C0006]